MCVAKLCKDFEISFIIIKYLHNTCKLIFNLSPRSISNITEAEFIVDLVLFLVKNKIAPDDIGIIAPYKKQKNVLMEELRKQWVYVELEMCNICI